MKTVLFAFLMSIAAFCYAEAQEWQVISADRWSAIRIAEAEARRTDQRLIDDMDKYEVWVSERDGMIVVSFIDYEAFGAQTGKPGAKGKQAHFVGFEVYLDKRTLRVIRSSFSR